MFTAPPGPYSGPNNENPNKPAIGFAPPQQIVLPDIQPKNANRRQSAEIIEEPIPPSDPPQIIQDKKHTVRPTNDRQILSNCIQSLAVKTFKTLELDANTKARFARRLVLSNRPPGQIANGRERFEVELPLEKSCWNDIDEEMIEYLMIDAVIKNTEIDHVWCKVRAEFDHFISKEAKMLMDDLDEQELGITNHRRISSYEQMEQEQLEANNNNSNNNDEPEAVIIMEDEEDDDDIQIVFTSSPK